MLSIGDLRPASTRAVMLTEIAAVAGARIIRDGMAVSGVGIISQDIAPGDLFIAVPGLNSHGARFAGSAIERGATAVLTDADGVALVQSLDQTIGILQVDDPRAMAGIIAAHVYGNPAQKMTTVGVTGTNGKTTTAHFIRHLCQDELGPTLLVGTVGISFANVHVDSERTSIEAPALHRVLAWALERGARAVIMEVSSHAMVLHRVEGVRFDVVAFTNLQRDHLDFHGSMEDYFAAKASLFTSRYAARAVICTDDEWGRRLAEQCVIPMTTVSTRGKADWTLRDHRLNERDAGTDVAVTHADRTWQFHCPLPGLINVQNGLVALASSIEAGVPPDTGALNIGTTPQVPGRMEVISHRSADTPLVIVDFAHTPEALSLACLALQPITPGRLWILFGATGDRDRGKRPLMARVAQESADVVILTDDDVYGEDPASIRAEIASGFGGDCPYARALQLWEDDDRAHAIAFAVETAAPADTVIIAGRGHETVQVVGKRAFNLDDRACAREALAARREHNAVDLSPFDAQNPTQVRLRKVPETWDYGFGQSSGMNSACGADGDDSA